MGRNSSIGVSEFLYFSIQMKINLNNIVDSIEFSHEE